MGPRAALGEPRRRSGRDLIIPIIGAVAPVALIVVNVAAFIVKHLAEFRWTITILAFESGIMLNSWVGLNIFRLIKRRRPDHVLVRDGNQEIVLVGGLSIVIIAAFLTALFCYLGLSNANDLPNALTFFVGLLAILVPILLQAAFRGAIRRQRKDRVSTATVSGLPPAEAPLPPGPPP